MQYCSSIHNRSPGGTPHQTAGSRSGGRALRNIPARNAAKRTQIWVRPASRSGRGSILPPGADLWRAAPTAAPHWYAPVPPARSEEHTSELQSLMRNTYAVYGLKTKYNARINTKLNTVTN